MTNVKHDTRILPSQEELLTLLTYVPDTGKLFWNKRDSSYFESQYRCNVWNGRYAGREAFTNTTRDGYKNGHLKASLFLAHRLIWKMEKGEAPLFIDHINGIRTDNRIDNLRSVTPEENSRNKKVHRINTSGVSGVYFNEALGKWHARISNKSGRVHLGFFSQKELAVQARKEAEARLGYHENHGRKGDLFCQ